MYNVIKKIAANLFLLSVFTSVMLASCQSSWRQPIPDGNIVYMAGYSELGFIQPDGTDNQIIEPRKRLAIPVWSNDGNIIYGLSGSGQAGAYGGYPAYLDLEFGRYKVCSFKIWRQNWPFYKQIQGSGNPLNPYEVIVMYVWEIVLIDLSRCKKVQTYVDYSAHPGDYSIAGFSYSPLTQELVYGLVVNPYKEDREYQLIQLDINTGNQVQMAEGINPSWSPDGTQIAYLGMDGLYVISAEGQGNKKVVYQPFFSPWEGPSPWHPTTFPQWSPDGKYIVYHRCSTEDLCRWEEAQIYRISSAGGPEILIHLGGKYPSWGDR